MANLERTGTIRAPLYDGYTYVTLNEERTLWIVKVEVRCDDRRTAVELAEAIENL